jgi:sulfur-oxidizing protein SoxZ
MMVRVLLNVPKTAHVGEVIEIKVLISHPMESGQRRDAMGQPIPRDIIHSLKCTWDDQVVLEAELFPAISANPFFAFTALAEKSGRISITFTDDNGAVQTETRDIVVG